MNDIIYLRMKKHIEIETLQTIQLKHIALVSAKPSIKKELGEIMIYQMTKKDNNIAVIDSFLVIDQLNKRYVGSEFQLLGPTHTIVRIKQQKKVPSLFVVVLVWLLLFIGTGMTIMNFHYDVSMQEVQQKIHYLLTGEKDEHPLWIQIPYSLGLGVGMILFLNHWFEKKINEEPSPLEVELFNYDQNIDDYLSHHENDLNDTKDVD